MSELTAKDIHWFRLANSNPSQAFYAFKDRFLRRFAVPAGFDLQHIDRMCWTCEGSGEYAKGVECNRCSGSGIYDVADHWLQRWNLAGQIYHKPMSNADVWHLHVYRWPEPVNEIHGHIKHSGVEPAASRRAYYRLLLRHEPVNFYWMIMSLIKDRLLHCRYKWVWCLIRLRNKLDLFKAIPEDDVPF